MINAKLQSIIDTKSAIGNAIVNKGGTITSETPFFNYAAQIDGISTGTPQTIFTASDGSKWALTNAVNLVNDAGNVTSDFNYWQPANNSTSDPILNIGTVGANISGNIQLVPVNQVNIAQYVNIVINDTTGAKYVGYNGYDSQTNPTPSGNTTFNRWLLNNSASGTVIFANTTVTNGGTYNGPNTSINEASMPFVLNSASYGGTITALGVNNGFVFAGGSGNGRILRYHESNLVWTSVQSIPHENPNNLVINNGFVYACRPDSFTSGYIRKSHESNLGYVGDTPNFGTWQIRDLAVNNSFLYAVGAEVSGINRGISKYHEGNLALVGNAANYGGTVQAIVINNGFIFIGGATNQTIQKFGESNLTRVSNSAAYGGTISNLAINNGFIYAVGAGGVGTVKKYHESNLVFVGNTVNYADPTFYSPITIDINNGFIYVGGSGNATNGRTVKKYYESNLAFLAETNNYGDDIQRITINNGFIYASGNPDVKKYQETGVTFDNQTFYTATKIKE